MTMKRYMVGNADIGQKVAYRLEVCIENGHLIEDSKCLEIFEQEIRSKSVGDGSVRVKTIKLERIGE